ncbi:MAG: aminopeptidase P family protein [Desulfobacterales bacterium]|nr:aminopeptidase P family protein [Desulfobacterales bacterium]
MDEKEKCTQRLRKLRKRLHARSIDMLWVLKEENRRYLSGFRGRDGHRDESAGSLFISESRQLLATDFRYTRQAETEAHGFELVDYSKGVIKVLPRIARDADVRRLGFEAGRVSCIQFQKLSEALKNEQVPVELVPCEGLIEDLRSVKDASELDAIRRSVAITEGVLALILEELEPGMSEKEVAWSIEKRIREKGAEEISFPPIVASGENAAFPHAIPTDRRIRKGEPIIIDMGSRLDGYCSDMTRTVTLGRPDAEFADIVNIVYDAQQKAIAAIRAGVSSRFVDGIARDYIDRKGFGDKFGHGLGHGVGLAVHEMPVLSPRRDTQLEAGMVVTVEPGIYIPGWGGVRLENMIVVQPDGADVLNRMPVLV